MKVITNPNQCASQALAATIGMFDGLHVGHQYLLQSLFSEAKRRGQATAVVTFSEHPQNVLFGSNQKWICTLSDRIKCLDEAGVDYLLLMDFTPQLAALDSTQFMDMLHRQYGVCTLMVGFNHRFGHNRSETFNDYCANGAKVGVEVVKAPEYQGELAPVSSSLLRGYITNGQVDEAAKRLWHPFAVSGVVVHGLKNGRKIGFPTANVGNYSSHIVLPQNGVYCTLTAIDGGELLPSMTNIGTRPTVLSHGDISIEVNILDFDSDIYDQQITVYFLHRLRSEAQFTSMQELKQQLCIDRDNTRLYFKSINIKTSEINNL